jgi:hypothetical protein
MNRSHVPIMKQPLKSATVPRWIMTGIVERQPWRTRWK